MFPEPPNRSNLTAHHGRLPSLWAAAQQGLFLRSNSSDKDSRGHSMACADTKTDSQDTSAHTQVLQSEAHAVSTPTQSPAAACLCHPDNIHSGSKSGRAGVSNQQQNAATMCQCSSRPPGTPATSTDSCESAAHQSQQESQVTCHDQPSQQGRWQAAPGGPSAKSLLHKLRWVALGPQFNWSTRQYEQEPGVQPLPPQLVSLAQHVVKACREDHVHQQEHGFAHSPGDDVSMQAGSPQHACDRTAWVPCGVGDQCPQYEPDTALVNFYRDGDTLGGHKDDAELQADCPIVSLSLGCDAVFLIGGATKDVVPTAVWLHGGDAVVLAGAARQCYHGVPRVVPCRTSFDCCVSNASAAVVKDMAALHVYMQSTRVNISVRQV